MRVVRRCGRVHLKAERAPGGQPTLSSEMSEIVCTCAMKMEMVDEACVVRSGHRTLQ